MNRRIFFLGGIHGVGKGTFSKTVSSKFGIKCTSASELIKWSELNQDPLNKKVKDIPSTQHKLLNALNSNCTENVVYLLDGHFCLLNAENVPTQVPEEVFIKINPELILLLTAPVETIKNRLETRDNKIYQFELLNKFQKEEIEYANYISKKLNCKLLTFSSNNMNHIEEHLKSIL